MNVAVTGGLRCRLFAGLTATLLLCIGGMASAGVVPTRQIHDIPFFIHRDLLDPAMESEDLAVFQGVIDAAIADAKTLLLGTQGPFDEPCCTEIVASGTPGATLTIFDGTDAGRPQSDLNVLNFDADQSALLGIIGSGSGVFFVDSLSNCASGAGAIGCASTPACSGNPNDDPDLILVITLEAFEKGVLGSTLAHERGHNSCLVHQPDNQCQLMQPAAGGGCLTASECGDFINGRTATGGPCSCHADSSSIVVDDTVCSEGSVVGVCSGGLCNPPGSPTSTRLLASADPDLIALSSGDFDIVQFDAQLSLSGASGDWRVKGPWGNPADEPQGLTYAPGRDLVYGVARTAGDDVLLSIDPANGSTLSRITIPNRRDIIALAWDPGGAGTSDDLLFGLESAAGFERLIEILPDTGTSTTIGMLAFGGIPGGVSGMAYDPVNDDLYVSFSGGLDVVDRTTCDPLGFSFCGLTELRDPITVTAAQPNGVTLASVGSSLAYSSVTGNIYMTGAPLIGFPSTVYTVILGGSIRPGLPPDPNAMPLPFLGADFVDTLESIGLDGMTVGGLAALPAPEPSAALLAGAALATLGALRRRRER